MRKVYVEVVARFDTVGKITPLWVVWEDGNKYEIEKVLDKRQAVSLKAGGQGIRYTILTSGRQTYLYYENPAWFVEGKE